MQFLVYQDDPKIMAPVTARFKIVADITAANAEAAAKQFCRILGKDWKQPVIQKPSHRRNVVDLWIRKFTATGRYRGETHFIIKKAER